MDFIKSSGIRVHLSKEDQAQLSAPERIKRALFDPQTIAFDIFDQDNLIGFAMLYQFDVTGFFLWDYAIDTAYQGKGSGKAALLELISLLEEKYDAKVITTTCKYDNARAKGLYESVGFQTVEVIDQDGIHEINLVKELDAE